MSGVICALFAVCGLSGSADGLPTWAETAHHAIPIVQRWEGLPRQYECDESPSGVCVRAYLDTIAEPDLPTIGYGQTRHFDAQGRATPVRMGDTMTVEDAVANLNRILREFYWTDYRECLTADAVAAETDAAFTSLTWNIGTGGVCRSTALRRLNAGDVAGACEALTWWNRAGGRVVRGLVNRRADEYQLCMEGAA
jgi:GH24 family phage-related lysozyme (muramidase)